MIVDSLNEQRGDCGPSLRDSGLRPPLLEQGGILAELHTGRALIGLKVSVAANALPHSRIMRRRLESSSSSPHYECFHRGKEHTWAKQSPTSDVRLQDLVKWMCSCIGSLGARPHL